MKHWQWSVWCLPLLLAGCMLGGRVPQKVASIPPPPPPAPAPQPPPRPEPLSIPQTQAQLPPPQPVNPQALAAAPSPEPSPETQPTPRTPKRPVGPVATPPKPPETATTPAQPAAPNPTPTPDTEVRATVQEIVPATEIKRLQESVAARTLEIRKVLEQAQARGITKDQKGVIARIQSFLQQSDEAGKRGDFRQADALAERAQVLARELTSETR